MIASRLRQSLGIMATSMGGDVLGVMQPVSTITAMTGARCLIFITFGMFGLAIVRHT
jgi:hypothetical protein